MNRYEQMEQDIQSRIKKCISESSELDTVTWPGMYPLYYITKDSGCLCPKCANENINLLSDPDDKQWYVIGYEINYENESLYCDNCNARIGSAYGDDEDDEEESNHD